MPTRILRDGINDSETVNAVSEEAELFYRRLYTYVDDYGRGAASPTLIRGKVFALRLDAWTEQRIEECLEECANAGLIFHYEVEGKKYLEIQKFGQRIREKVVSKFPEPCSASRNSAATSSEMPQNAARATTPPTTTATPSSTPGRESERNQNPGSLALVTQAPVDSDTDPAFLVSQVCEMYAAGGVPVPISTQTYAERVLVARAPLERLRLPRYVAWAFQSGRWSTVAKTKSLANLLKDGDWDVDSTPRILPKARDPDEKGADDIAARMQARNQRLKDRFGATT